METYFSYSSNKKYIATKHPHKRRDIIKKKYKIDISKKQYNVINDNISSKENTKQTSNKEYNVINDSISLKENTKQTCTKEYNVINDSILLKENIK